MTTKAKQEVETKEIETTLSDQIDTLVDEYFKEKKPVAMVEKTELYGKETFADFMKYVLPRLGDAG